MSNFETLECFLRTIIAAIAKHTPEPKIVHLDKEYTFQIQVDGRDQGRIVGKGGAHIWAIQTLFWYAGFAQVRQGYSIRLLEPVTPYRGGPSPFRFTATWDRKIIQGLIDAILETCIPSHGSCELKEETKTSAVCTLKIEKYLQTPTDNPSLAEAISVVLKAAGMSQGVSIQTVAAYA
jgi:predicted RNA-binding protein YlqC (UPF0109 family)